MTDWNQRYAESDTPWDKGAPAPPLEELLEKPDSGNWFGAGSVLVPGCGAGYDVKLLAETFESKIVGIDIAPLAIQKARMSKTKDTELYEEVSWFDYELPTSDLASAIWEHTCFCAIDPSQRGAYAESVMRLLKPGGYFFGVFFLETGSEEGPPWPSKLAEIKQYFEAGYELIYEQEPTRCYPGREGREIVLGWRKTKSCGQNN